MARDAWDHNNHYHPVILNAIPAVCRRALDVGCGTGTLTRRLRRSIPQVTGIDTDERSIRLARSYPGAVHIDYVLDDFLSHAFDTASFDMVTAVASLHHMDAASAVLRMSELLRPGGVLAVIGLARGSSVIDLAMTIPAVITNWICALDSKFFAETRPAEDVYKSPTLWPPRETYGAMHRLATRLLPGVRYRRHLLWRYSLIWVKPG